jgi:hypothetical protein
MRGRRDSSILASRRETVVNPAAVTLVIVRVVYMTMAVGAAFRLKRACNVSHYSAQPFHHCLEDVIGKHEQDVGVYLQRHMPVADVIGDTRELFGIRGADLMKRFISGEHFDDAPVAKREFVAVSEHRADL